MRVLEKVKMQNSTKVFLILGIFLIVIGTVLLVPNAFASPVPVKSVTITSEKLDYNKKEPGSFSVEKSAEWIARGKARITFDLDTIMKTEKKYTDIIFVLDISGSMDGDKLTRVKQDSIDLINTLLSDSNNRGALITFETASQLVLGLTNNKDELTSAINNLTTTGCTNYYQALVNVDKILKDYKKEENRECIVLFLTDGYPNEDTPNEEGQYNYLRKQYPYVTINGVQYEMGSDVLDPIKKVSDQQFIADVTNLNNVLFEASVAPSTYNEFLITDYINDDYFEIDSVDNIVASVGTTSLEIDNNTPKVIWNIDNLRSGSKATLTIDINLKKEFLNTGGIYPTNKKEEIKVEIDKVKEDITSPKTPVLADNYRVIYDGNAPDGCSVKNIPNVTSRSVFDTVEISNQSAVCDGYQFKGWRVITENIKRINDTNFIMPESDVVIRAMWGKNSITKSIDGEVYVAPPSIIKSVSWDQKTELWKYKLSIIKIVFENSISDKETAIETFDISDKKNESVIVHIVPNNDDSSTYTAYIQGNEKVIANSDSSNLFYNFSKLTSIEGLEYFDTSNATKMSEMFNGCKSLKTLDLSDFDTSKVVDMGGMFYGCDNLVNLNLVNFDTRKVSIMRSMFYRCSSLTDLNLNNFDTSQVTSMWAMFSKCSNLTSLNLSQFDTSNVTNMSKMFEECSNLTSLDLSQFDTSNVTNMSDMFSKCSNLTSLDLSDFDTSNVTNMGSMFEDCSGLTSLSISNLDTSNTTIMYDMFNGCSSLENLDLSSFNTSNVTSMSSMFYSCSSLKNLNLSSFNTSNVTSMSSMFYSCSSLENLDLSMFNTSNVTSMSSMFSSCSSLENLDLSTFNTSNVTSMRAMFNGCSTLTSLDLHNFNTSKVTDMSFMFSYCSGLTNMSLSSFNTSNVTKMDRMFTKCRSLTTLDLSSFNTSKVTTMYIMFEGCNSLTSLDLSSFETGNVTTMESMFDGCSSLVSLEVSNFDTSNVRNVEKMFNGCSSLLSLDLSNFDTNNVTSMSYMFHGCKSLKTLDLSSFDTSNVTCMWYMFSGCQDLTSLDLSSFDTSNLTNAISMFSGCSNLVTLNLEDFNTSKLYSVSRMFSGCSNLTTTLTIKSSSMSYDNIFYMTSTKDGTQLIINYTTETSDLVDKMIATKSSGSNVVKGQLVT